MIRLTHWCLSLAVAILLVTGVQAQGTLKDTVRALIVELYDRGNIAVVDTHFASDFIRHPGDSDVSAFKIAILALRAAMPDLQSEVEWLIQQDNLVAARLWLRGTFTGEYIAPDALPIPPTNQPVELVANVIYRFDEAGLLAEEWDGFDNLRFYSQLGLIAVPGASASTMQYPAVVDIGMSEQNRQVIEQYFTAYNQGNWAVVDSSFKADFVSHSPFGLLDRASMVADLTRLRGALPDMSASVEALITEGNWTATFYTLRGTFTNSFVAGETITTPPTGQPLNLLIVTFYRFDEQGLVAEAFELYDSLNFMTQLGLLSLVALPTATPPGS